MSVSAINYVFALPIKSSPQKLVLLAIANRISDDTGRCFPGQALLADECTMSERQVREHLASLQDEGRINRFYRHNGNEGRTSDEYEIVGFLDWNKRGKADARKAAGGGNPPVAEKGERNRRKKVSVTGGNPPGNPKRNPKIEEEISAKENLAPVCDEISKPSKRGKPADHGQTFSTFWALYRNACKTVGGSSGSMSEAAKAFAKRNDRAQKIAIEMIEAFAADCAEDNGGRGRAMLHAVRYLSRDWPEQLFEAQQEGKIAANETEIKTKRAAARLALDDDNWRVANRFGWKTRADIPSDIMGALA